jgi:ubiquinone/menaquinone biosynthesis C-methylase UbiE
MTESWPRSPGFLRAPNISRDPELYEIENNAADPDGAIETKMRRIAPWEGKVLADIGAGTGFHLERFHQQAEHVVALEPDPDLRLLLMQRIVDHRLTRTSVVGASAASMPLQNDAVDIAHARFAYFFGPGCEPGIAELRRVVKPGGTAFIIDNDLRSGTFARWIRAAYQISESAIADNERFWVEQGFTIERLASCWRFENRDALERVIYLEFPAEHAAAFVANVSGLEIDYNLLLIHATF